MLNNSITHTATINTCVLTSFHYKDVAALHSLLHYSETLHCLWKICLQPEDKHFSFLVQVHTQSHTYGLSQHTWFSYVQRSVHVCSLSYSYANRGKNKVNYFTGKLIRQSVHEPLIMKKVDERSGGVTCYHRSSFDTVCLLIMQKNQMKLWLKCTEIFANLLVFGFFYPVNLLVPYVCRWI